MQSPYCRDVERATWCSHVHSSSQAAINYHGIPRSPSSLASTERTDVLTMVDFVPPSETCVICKSADHHSVSFNHLRSFGDARASNYVSQYCNLVAYVVLNRPTATNSASDAASAAVLLLIQFRIVLRIRMYCFGYRSVTLNAGENSTARTCRNLEALSSRIESREKTRTGS